MIWPFHRHKWQMRGLRHAQYALFGKGDVTVVLSGCETCPKLKSEHIDGLWSAEELGRGNCHTPSVRSDA